MKKRSMNSDSVRVIKIGKEALFEFIYEQFIDDQELFFDVDELEVTDCFDMDWENGQFIFCVYKSEDKNGRMLSFPREIQLQQLLKKIPDTTPSMYMDDHYREYTKDELRALSKTDRDG